MSVKLLSRVVGKDAVNIYLTKYLPQHKINNAMLISALQIYMAEGVSPGDVSAKPQVTTQVVWNEGRMGCPRKVASKEASRSTPCLRKVDK
jgi:hypothetical protein